MEIKKGNVVSGIDVYGKEVNGKVVNVSSTFGFAVLKTGEDRLDKTVIDFKNIKLESNV